MTTEAAIETTDLQTQRLVRGVRTGDPDAWRVLYDELGEAVFRLLYRLTGEEDLARDLAHDTFVIVAEKGRQYANKGPLKAWVFRIAANLAKERLRNEKARRLREAEMFGTQPGPLDGSDTELRLVLDQALAELSEEQRVALLLHDVDGYTHPEIARMMNVAEGTSKARVSRARAHLRRVLQHRL